MDHVPVTGAAGIIGGHLVGRLRDLGVGHIRAVDHAWVHDQVAARVAR
jgi:nucleoside-diphosphate-sugar epimerase